jgi:hypothetical protein
MITWKGRAILLGSLVMLLAILLGSLVVLLAILFGIFLLLRKLASWIWNKMGSRFRKKPSAAA